jgi:hypothetical protein
MTYILVEVYGRFRKTCCLYRQGLCLLDILFDPEDEGAFLCNVCINFYQTARYHTPENGIVHTRYRENLRSRNMTCAFYQDRLRVLLWTGHSQFLKIFFVFSFIISDAVVYIISVVESQISQKQLVKKHMNADWKRRTRVVTSI